eukprot:scaffold46248_cov42-Cyclotella_meneghiniana.AAC.1
MANNNGQDECEYATLNWRREIPTAASTIGNRLWSMVSMQNKCVSANTKQLTGEERCRRLHRLSPSRVTTTIINKRIRNN